MALKPTLRDRVMEGQGYRLNVRWLILIVLVWLVLSFVHGLNTRLDRLECETERAQMRADGWYGGVDLPCP